VQVGHDGGFRHENDGEGVRTVVGRRDLGAVEVRTRRTRRQWFDVGVGNVPDVSSRYVGVSTHTCDVVLEGRLAGNANEVVRTGNGRDGLRRG
jgi:hypothetical protein